MKHRARRQLRARPLRMRRRGARRLVGPHVVRPTVEGRRPGIEAVQRVRLFHTECVRVRQKTSRGFK